MEGLIESISEKTGSKWAFLLNELNLDPRTKSKIEKKHLDVPPKERGKLRCKEVLKLWLQKSSNEGDEMKELISIIGKISFLKSLAHEASFNLLMSTPTQSLPIGGTREEARTSKKDHPVPSVYQTWHGGFQKQWQQPTSHDLALSSWRYLPTQPVCVSDEVSRGHIHAPVTGDVQSALPPSCQTNGFVATLEAAASGITTIAVRDPCDEVILVRDRFHKYALLDASQRILRSNWKVISQKLNIPKESIENLEKERNFHERYYKLFLEYVRVYRENATFLELRKVLLECDESMVVALIEERLRTRKELVISAVEYDFLSKKDH